MASQLFSEYFTFQNLASKEYDVASRYTVINIMEFHRQCDVIASIYCFSIWIASQFILFIQGQCINGEQQTMFAKHS